MTISEPRSLKFEQAVLRLLALLSTSFAFGLSPYYYLLDSRIIAFTCLLQAMISLTVFAGAHWRPQWIEALRPVFLASTLILILTGISLNTSTSVNDPWLILFAALAFSLARPRTAWYWSILALVATFALRTIQTYPVPLPSAINLAVAFIATTILASIFSVENEKNQHIIGELGNTDSLTGLLNRRSFVETIEAEFRRNLRQAEAMAVFMADIDHFKSYNDHYGHVRGDHILAGVAAAIRQSARRPGDFAFRYGGEEFCILCSGVDAAQAAAFAETLRANIEALALEHKPSPTGWISISVGYRHAKSLASLTPEQLLEDADKALYLAKASGRNRVESWISA